MIAAFIKEPVLVHFDPEKQIVLETDASDRAMGARICQPDEKGRLRTVAFYSKKFQPAELNYEIHDKELFAIVAAMREWRVYLEGSKYPVQVYSDHKNLLYFTTTKVLNRRQARWAETLAAYNYNIYYKKGIENGVADALSRRADYFKGKEEARDHSILKLAKDGTISYNHTLICGTIIISTGN